jgi:hypothetical protein
MALSKYHKNDLFMALKASGVPIDEFELLDDYTHATLIPGTKYPIPVTVVHHRRSGSMFVIMEAGLKISEVSRYDVQLQIGSAKPSVLDHWKISNERRRVNWEEIPLMVRQWAELAEQKKHRDQEYSSTPDFRGEYLSK